jgi:hypothetical protein
MASRRIHQRLAKIACVLVHCDQLASRIVNANYSGVRATEKLRVGDSVSYSVFASQ